MQEVNSKPLPFDVDVLRDIAVSLNDIQAAYQLLDDFWVTELESLSKAIDTVHVPALSGGWAIKMLDIKLESKSSLNRLSPFSGPIVDSKSAGAFTNDRVDVELDADTQTPAVRV